MKIEIDTNHLRKSGLTGSQYLYLLILQVEGTSSKSLFYEAKRGFQRQVELEQLIGSGEGKLDMLSSYNEMSKNGNKLFQAKLATNKDSQLKEILLQMREHFPKAVVSGNQSVRSTVSSVLIRKFRKILTEFDYDIHTMMQATKIYVKRCHDNDNYKYMKTFSNFVSHQEKGSVLVDICEEIKSKEIDAEQPTTGGVKRIQKTL